MDFGELLYAAQRNEHQAKMEPVKCYRTSFDPPKREQKNKTLSSNIQKFLARKEEEEKRRSEEARKKREELLALRSQDGMARKRVQAMLKRTKAANKSVIDDAIDEDNTAVTLGGPYQPDEDDYGYVSQEASAFYNKLMDKYKSAPAEEPMFPERSSKPVYKDLNSTKDRVKAALEREKEEEMMPHKRKRKSKDKGKEADDGDTTINYSGSDLRDLNDNCRYKSQDEEDDDEEEKPIKPAKPKRPAPPPMDFHALLKLAEKKQFEPIKVEPRVKVEEDERPMTKKQKMEFLKEQEWRRRKEETGTRGEGNRGVPSQRIPKLNESLREERSDSVPRIPKLSNRDERQSDGGHMNPKVSKDERQRIPKLNSSRDERQSDSGQRTPNLNSCREERPSDSGQRIPKLISSRDERQSDSGPRILKLNKNRSDKQNDLGDRVPRLSGSNDTRCERNDSSQKMFKVNLGERNMNSGGRISNVGSNNGYSSRDERQNIDQILSRGSSNRNERQGDNSQRISQVSEREERFSSSGNKAVKREGSQSDIRDRVKKIGISDSQLKNSRVNVSSEKTSKINKGNEGRRDDTTYKISKQSDNREGSSQFQQRVYRREDFQKPKIIKQNGMFSRVENSKAQNNGEIKTNVKFLKKDESEEKSGPMKLSNNDSFRKVTGYQEDRILTQDRSKINNFSSSNSSKQSNYNRMNDEQKEKIDVRNKPPQLSGYSKKLQESLSAKLKERREAAEKSKKCDDRELKSSSKPSSNPPLKPGTNVMTSSKQKNIRSVSNDSSRKEGLTNRPNLQGQRSVAGGGLPARVQNPNKPQQLSSQNDRGKLSSISTNNIKPKQFPPSDVKARQFPPPDVKPKQFPPTDVRSRQFPPADVRRKQFPPKDMRRIPRPPVKRRIEDSDEEYDSEMDDFIDDGPEEEEDYSRHIKEIFGYDRNRYRDVDDEDECMESSFAQQLKEEYVSAKIGILEDLEDIEKEQMEKKRKAMMKKKRR